VLAITRFPARSTAIACGSRGTPAIASARLTTGNTLIWGTRQVALRLEDNLGKTAALAIANSAH